MNIAFDQQSLFAKAKLYSQRALGEERSDENSLFPFWLSLALEFLARSTIASINPLLLAENKQGDGIHLLSALGYGIISPPRSIMISTALEMLTKVSVEFSKKDKETCSAIIEERNAELHSGTIGYEKFPARLWLGDYYRICKTLLKIQDMNLEDLFGVEEAAAAEIMIADDQIAVKSKIIKMINDCKKSFLKLTDIQRDAKREEATEKMQTIPNGSKRFECPACKTEGLLSGKLISVSEPKLDDEDIKQDYRYLPESFICYACKLHISNYAELRAVEIGSQYSVMNYLDPVEYHRINIQDQVDAEIEKLAYGDDYGDE